MRYLILLTTILLPALLQAEPVWLLCPYVPDPLGGRMVSVSPYLPTQQVGQREPWAAQETADNQAVVHADINAAALTTLTTDANCTQLTRENLLTDRTRPEETRTVLRQRRTVEGQAIAPIADTVVTDLEQRITTRATWHVPSWLGPRAAWAQLGAFPTCTVIDAFNRANETPIAAPWAAGTGIEVAGSAIAGINLAGNQVSNPDGSDRVSYYNSACDTDCDVEITLTNADPNFIVGGRLVDLGNEGDGYDCQATGTLLRIRRQDNGAATTLGAAITVPDWVSGDDLGCRMEGTTITGYQNQGAVGSRVDATYTAAGFAYLGASSAETADNFCASVDIPLARKKSILWFR